MKTRVVEVQIRVFLTFLACLERMRKLTISVTLIGLRADI